MKQLSTFEKALLDVTLEEYADISPDQDEEPELSPTFLQKMERLSRRVDQKGNYRPRVIKRRLFLVAAIIVFALAATAAWVPAIREGLIHFFTQDSGVAYTIHFTKEDVASAPKEIETYYAPSYVPEGYTENSDSGHGVWIYETMAGDFLEYDQNVIWQDDPSFTDGNPIHMSINSEGMDVRYFVVDGFEIMVIESKDGGEANYVWTDYNYLYSISAVPAIDTNEIVKMISSLKPQK